MPTRAAKMTKSTLQYLDGKTSTQENNEIPKITHFSPFWRSPAPFRRIKQ
jgi:hypothetical protein